MALYQVQMMDEAFSTVTVWKEKPSVAAVLVWAKEQAIELFGKGMTPRFRIEEEKPVV